VKALDNVRDHIKTTIAQANLEKEIGESSLDTRLAQLRAQSGEVTARQQLEQLKAAQAQKALGQKKTM
jgi:phage shock protein A